METTLNRSGTRTSEFKVFIGMALFILASSTEWVTVDPDSMKWFLGFAATYIGSRTATKVSANWKKPNVEEFVKLLKKAENG